MRVRKVLKELVRSTVYGSVEKSHRHERHCSSYSAATRSKPWHGKCERDHTLRHKQIFFVVMYVCTRETKSSL